MSKTNLAFMGMPAVGKTTVGKIVAEKLAMDFCDADEIFVSRYGNISEFFARYGENCFRALEREISTEAACRTDSVISLGGGAVLDSIIMETVKRNCTVILLTASFDVLERRIAFNADRPLMKNKADIERLFLARKHLYEKYADITFDTSLFTPEQSANRIKEMLK